MLSFLFRIRADRRLLSDPCKNGRREGSSHIAMHRGLLPLGQLDRWRRVGVAVVSCEGGRGDVGAALPPHLNCHVVPKNIFDSFYSNIGFRIFDLDIKKSVDNVWPICIVLVIALIPSMKSKPGGSSLFSGSTAVIRSIWKNLIILE